MEGAIGLIVLLLIGVLIIPLILTSGTNSRVKEMSSTLQKMEALLLELRLQMRELAQQKPVADTTQTNQAAPTVTEITPEPAIEETPEAPPIITEVIPEATLPEPFIIPDIVPEAAAVFLQDESLSEEINTGITEPFPEQEPYSTTSIEADPLPSKPPRIKQDLERFIGEKLMSFVGIGILVLGIFFTVKWAIDKKLIGDAGKVLIGLLCGTILIAVAHRIRKAYHTFSSILVGGGLAVLYFTIYIAFQDYHLLSQVPAFIAMVGVTTGAVVLSILYDRKELAVIALIGGFATPFFVSNNQGNYQVLFSYILVLNLGMFALAYYKKWNLINIISYAATVLLYMIWISTRFAPEQAMGAFVFASLFYLVFFGMNIIYNIRHNTSFRAIEIGMLLSNTFLYFGAGLYCLHFIGNGFYNGIFTIALAVFNLAFAYRFYRSNKIDKNLVYLLIGLVLTFVSLTAPIQLEGNYITLFWAAEMVLLYWLGRKSGIQLIRNTSVIVMGLTLISLVMDWSVVYGIHNNKLLPLMLNRAFISGSTVFIALVIQRKLVLKEEESTTIAWLIPVSSYKIMLKLLLIAVLYLLLLLELSYQLSTRIGHESFTAMAIWIYHYLFAAVLFIYARKKHSNALPVIAGGIVFLLVLYVVAARAIFNVQLDVLKGTLAPPLLLWHYALPILALINLYFLVRFVPKKPDPRAVLYQYAPWFFTVAAVFIFSNETVRIWTMLAYEKGFDIYVIQIKAIKIALPILWSICSLVMMLLGMNYRVKVYRIISISLFALTILKLFVYDISDVGQGGKIAAFVLLGIILLIVSFLYQKIKGLFIDDHESGTQTTGEE